MLFSDAPYIVRGVSTYQDVCVFCVSGHLNILSERFGEKQKNNSAANDFNDDKSGRGYPRMWGLFLN